MRLIPDIYVHKIEDIPYDKLKEEGIKALVFDLDNTLATLDEKACPERVKKLINKLNKDFTCIREQNRGKNEFFNQPNIPYADWQF